MRKLISGLDKDSVETVYRIISRLRASISNQTYLIKDLNKQEINVLNQHHSEFYPNIFEVIPGKNTIIMDIIYLQINLRHMYFGII